ncbi:hypothetical protein N0V88_004201 [Collariella sp. IMI 366227]|nr:hypothetical protein N0V88_004201 [Collariella sp. IMI 366227]
MIFLTSLPLLFFTTQQFRLVSSSPDDSNLKITQASWKPSETAGHKPVFTLPAEADRGMNIIPNIHDPEAVDAQEVCPGYKATNVQSSNSGFTADLDLAGKPCNVYGNDVEHLSLAVEFQTDDRVHIEIKPRYITPENETWFILPEVLIPRPAHNTNYQKDDSDFTVSWSNTPSFSFTVKRKATDDVLFTTEGKVLVYEDQFIEFVSALPEDYNLYGLGEVMHAFRLGNNLTRTLFAADVADNIDANLYGSHPIYLDTLPPPPHPPKPTAPTSETPTPRKSSCALKASPTGSSAAV